MNVLCYGVSEQQQRERCEFFLGAGCDANWATDLGCALALLTTKPFDAVVFGNAIGSDDCESIAQAMSSVRPGLTFFSLADIEAQLCSQQPSLGDHDRWAPLATIYLRLNSRESVRS